MPDVLPGIIRSVLSVDHGEDYLAARFLITVLLTFVPAAPSASTLPGRILFIGNSYTLYNGGLDVHVRGMAAASGTGDTCATVRRIQGGATLSSHWHTYRSQDAIDTSYGAVVLQGYLHYAAGIDSFIAACRLFAGRADSLGVRAVLLANWANPFSASADLDAAAIKAVYDSAAGPAGMGVIHAGAAFDAYEAAYPESLLLCDDIGHPSAAGTYLATCCIYAYLGEVSPVGLAYDGGLVDGWRRTYLQELAWFSVGSGARPSVGYVAGGTDVPRFRAFGRGAALFAELDGAVPGVRIAAYGSDGRRLVRSPGGGTGGVSWRCPFVPGVYNVVLRTGEGAVWAVRPVFVMGSVYR